MPASAALIEYAEEKLIVVAKAALWQQFERWTRPRRNAVERKMQGFFRAQHREVISSISAGKAAFTKGPSEWLDQQKWLLILEEYGQLFLPEVIGDKGDLEMRKLLIGVDFDVENPRVLAFINQRSFKFSFDTNKGTQKALQAIFTESISAGEGVRELSARINTLFQFKNKHQAEQIARSEVIRAANFGAEQSYLQSGVVSEKEWIVSRDLRLCPYCEPMKGRRVVVGMVFFQQGEVLPNADFPNQFLKLDYEDIFHPPLHVH